MYSPLQETVAKCQTAVHPFDDCFRFKTNPPHKNAPRSQHTNFATNESPPKISIPKRSLRHSQESGEPTWAWRRGVALRLWISRRANRASTNNPGGVQQELAIQSREETQRRRQNGSGEHGLRCWLYEEPGRLHRRIPGPHWHLANRERRFLRFSDSSQARSCSLLSSAVVCFFFWAVLLQRSTDFTPVGLATSDFSYFLRLWEAAMWVPRWRHVLLSAGKSPFVVWLWPEFMLFTFNEKEIS